MPTVHRSLELGWLHRLGKNGQAQTRDSRQTWTAKNQLLLLLLLAGNITSFIAMMSILGNCCDKQFSKKKSEL